MGTKASSVQRFSVLLELVQRAVRKRRFLTFPDLSARRCEIHCRRDGSAITRDEGPVDAGAKVLTRKVQSLGVPTWLFA